MPTSPPLGADRPPLTAKTKWLLALLVVVGVVIRLALALTTKGVGPDMDAYRLVLYGLRATSFHVYERFIDPKRYWWPYPPGFFPWVVATGRMTSGLLRFEFLIRLPMIVADCLLTLLIVYFLRVRGATERTLLAAAALVALGPSFILISGYHGQIDSVMILPAVAAVALWELSGERRVGTTSLLLGLAATFKTVPVILLSALLPRMRTWPDRLRSVGGAAIVPLAALLPFAVASPRATLQALKYGGLPGFGGLSLVIQPSAADWWFGAPYRPSAVTRLVFANQLLFAAVVFAAVTVFLLIRRPPILDGAVLIWLAFYAFVPNFAFQYLVWGLPFFIMAGYLRAALGLQLWMLTPSIILYAHIHLVDLYVALMLVAWIGFVVAFMLQARKIVRCTQPDSFRNWLVPRTQRP